MSYSDYRPRASRASSGKTMAGRKAARKAYEQCMSIEPEPLQEYYQYAVLSRPSARKELGSNRGLPEPRTKTERRIQFYKEMMNIKNNPLDAQNHELLLKTI